MNNEKEKLSLMPCESFQQCPPRLCMILYESLFKNKNKGAYLHNVHSDDGEKCETTWCISPRKSRFIFLNPRASTETLVSAMKDLWRPPKSPYHSLLSLVFHGFSTRRLYRVIKQRLSFFFFTFFLFNNILELWARWLVISVLQNEGVV